MNQVHTRGYASEDTRAAKPGTPITFVASTGEVARDGLVIDQDGWQLDNYRANPVVLWSHDYFEKPPIGIGTNLRLEDGNLKVDISFDQDDPFAVNVERKIRAGYLNSVSVGWDIKEFAPGKGESPSKSLVSELLDISVVNVPGDAKALAERAQRSLVQDAKRVIEILEIPEQTDDTPNPETNQSADEPDAGSATWDETAAEMVRLFQPFAQRSDEDRKADHVRLTRAYARLDKTAPEFLSAADIEALDPSDIRGLFLEGEPELLPRLFGQIELRAGKAFSARNLADIEQIHALASGLLERASKEAEEAEQTEDERAAQFLTDLKNAFEPREGK